MFFKKKNDIHQKVEDIVKVEEESTYQFTLKYELKTISETVSNDNLIYNIEQEYNNIIAKLKQKASEGYYEYFDNHYNNTYKNELILKGVCNKLILQGLVASYRQYGYTSLKLEISWR